MGKSCYGHFVLTSRVSVCYQWTLTQTARNPAQQIATRRWRTPQLHTTHNHSRTHTHRVRGEKGNRRCWHKGTSPPPQHNCNAYTMQKCPHQDWGQSRPQNINKHIWSQILCLLWFQQKGQTWKTAQTQCLLRGSAAKTTGNPWYDPYYPIPAPTHSSTWMHVFMPREQWEHNH